MGIRRRPYNPLYIRAAALMFAQYTPNHVRGLNRVIVVVTIHRRCAHVMRDEKLKIRYVPSRHETRGSERKYGFVVNTTVVLRNRVRDNICVRRDRLRAR